MGLNTAENMDDVITNIYQKHFCCLNNINVAEFYTPNIVNSFNVCLIEVLH